ncbi:hypothetical protein K3495_g11943 [Podosphaera aphanis]|nr:hypothetical protein K3495_g11943 [Podosphaera aphanis]
MSDKYKSSKADREIIAQGSGGASDSSSEKAPQLGVKLSPRKREKGLSNLSKSTTRFMSKGKAAVRSMEEGKFDDEDEMKREEMPQTRWGEPVPRRQAPESQTVLDWSLFDWKLDQKSFLREIENYSIYRETTLL